MKTEIQISPHRLRAIATNYGFCHEPDVRLVEQILEVDAVHQEFQRRLDELIARHRGNAPYLRRCRDARRKQAAKTKRRKMKLLREYWPGFRRLDVCSH
jgi:hypothetical protein